MSAPFTPLNPARRSVLERLLGRRPRENAVVEVNNMLAAADSVQDVTAADMAHVLSAHRTTLTGPLAGRFERLYRDFLAWCLEDRQLSDAELADLAHLQRLLRIPADTAFAIHEHVARQVYSRSVAQVLDDGVIDADERAFLGRLQHQLAISGKAAHRILEAKLRQRRRDN